jgi:hypothetical protein
VFTLSKKSIIAGTAVLALVGGGAAYAYFTTNGSGGGVATVSGGLTNGIQLSTGAIGALAPESVVTDVDVLAKNIGAEPVSVESVALAATPVTVDPAHAEHCDAEWFDVVLTPDAMLPVALPVLVSVGSVDVSMPKNLDDNQDACKGATITVNLVTPTPTS